MPDRARLALLDEPLPEGLGPLDRLQFGVEFCEHLLPPPEDVELAAAEAATRGLGFSLITPYVTDRFLPRVDEAVDAALRGHGGVIEVVFADWGVLRRLRRFGTSVVAVIGRTLNRAQRDPRLPDVGPEHLGGDDAPDSWARASHDSQAFDRFLRARNVRRVETDVPLGGLGSGDAVGPEGAGIAVHLPFGMVATGRLCVVNGLGKPPSLRFIPPPACDAPCRTYTLTLRAPWQHRDAEGVGVGEVLPLSALLARRRNRLPPAEEDRSPRFLQKGNTHFYRLDPEATAAALVWARSHPRVDRVVWSPVLPM